MNFLILVTLFATTFAYGWGNLGHQAVGEIAERNLTDKAKAMIFDALDCEPLSYAAMFPDQVREDPRFKDFADYHFFNVQWGQSAADGQKANESKKSADTFISKAPAWITAANTPRAQRAVFLRYYIHLVGDVHQPLHVGMENDAGANLCSVKFTDPTGTVSMTNLHSIWDDTLFDYEKDDFFKRPTLPGAKKEYFSYEKVADLALEAFEKDPAKANSATLKTAPPVQWYTESLNLHAAVYPGNVDGTPVTKPQDRKYCNFLGTPFKKIDPAAIPVLTADYARKSLAIANKQLVLAGLRLAQGLNDMAEKMPPTQTTAKACPDTLDAVQLEKRAIPEQNSIPHAPSTEKETGTHSP